MITLNEYRNIEDSIDQLLPTLTEQVLKTVDEKQHCVLALAGGNTPKPLYKALSNQDLPWANIMVTLTDERWVDTQHKDSNENMIKQTLLTSAGSRSNFIPLKNNSETAAKGVGQINNQLEGAAPKLDVVILGMGEDGHFASIFPEVDNLEELLDPKTDKKCLAVSPQGKEQRISLSYSYILSADIIFLLISGDKKKAIVDEVINGSKVAMQYPISALLTQNKCPVQVFWNP